MAEITIKHREKRHKIDARLHSQFIEMLGGCIYDGIWVGEDSEIPNIRGIRKDFVEALKEIAPPVIRWPGGCYADMYHWRDGVGPRELRPVTFNENFGTYELDTNQFGIHEFMDLCRLTGAKPWLNINMLSGTVAEMKEWMEYCNREQETTLKKEREKNGSPEAFGVEYWGIGNEPWAGGGNYTAQGYVAEYRKYATAAPNFRESMTKPPKHPMRMILCGPDGNKPIERVKWTKDVFASLGEYRCPPLEGYDLHFYNWNVDNPEDTDVTFDEAGWYKVIRSCFELEDVIKEQYALIQDGLKKLPKPEGDLFEGPEKTCDIYVGEWGNWHASAFMARPALFQQVTMRDAITSALTLDIFHRNCDKVKMACTAQTVNVLNSLFLTDKEKMIKTPNYDVFQMYMVHREATLLECTCDDPDLYTLASEKDGIISVNVVNISYSDGKEVKWNLPEGYTYMEGSVLASENPDDCNTWEEPDKIRAKESPASEKRDGVWTALVPKASVSVYRFTK